MAAPEPVGRLVVLLLPDGTQHRGSTTYGDEVEVEVVPAERLREAVDLLHDVANAGVAFDDPRIDYVEVQIDRATWHALAVHRGS